MKFTFQPEVFIKTIVGINIGMFVVSLLLSAGRGQVGNTPMTILSPNWRVLSLLGMTGSGMVQGGNGWWTLLAANYLHGGIIHILFNMVAFWQLCPVVIREYGISRTLIIYTVSGMIGFGLSVLAGVYATLGASASVCGLMGALIYFGKSRGGVYGQVVYRQVGGWALSIFIFGLLIQTVNNWAHAGGLIGGIALGFLLGYEERAREKSGHQRLAKILSLATLGVLLWGCFKGILGFLL